MAAVYIEQLQAGGLEPVEHDLAEPLHQFLAQVMVLVALAAQAQGGATIVRPRPRGACPE